MTRKQTDNARAGDRDDLDQAGGKVPVALVLAVVLLFLAGCGGGKGGGGKSNAGTGGRVRLTIEWPTNSRHIPQTATRVEVSVLDAETGECFFGPGCPAAPFAVTRRTEGTETQEDLYPLPLHRNLLFRLSALAQEGEAGGVPVYSNIPVAGIDYTIPALKGRDTTPLTATMKATVDHLKIFRGADEVGGADLATVRDQEPLVFDPTAPADVEQTLRVEALDKQNRPVLLRVYGANDDTNADIAWGFTDTTGDHTLTRINAARTNIRRATRAAAISIVKVAYQRGEVSATTTEAYVKVATRRSLAPELIPETTLPREEFPTGMLTKNVDIAVVGADPYLVYTDVTGFSAIIGPGTRKYLLNRFAYENRNPTPPLSRLVSLPALAALFSPSTEVLPLAALDSTGVVTLDTINSFTGNLIETSKRSHLTHLTVDIAESARSDFDTSGAQLSILYTMDGTGAVDRLRGRNDPGSDGRPLPTDGFQIGTTDALRAPGGTFVALAVNSTVPRTGDNALYNGDRILRATIGSVRLDYGVSATTSSGADILNGLPDNPSLNPGGLTLGAIQDIATEGNTLYVLAKMGSETVVHLFDIREALTDPVNKKARWMYTLSTSVATAKETGVQLRVAATSVSATEARVFVGYVSVTSVGSNRESRSIGSLVYTNREL